MLLSRYLVTTFKIVPRGTEGAVSVEGTIAGLLASILLSFVGCVMGEVLYTVFPLLLNTCSFFWSKFFLDLFLIYIKNSFSFFCPPPKKIQKIAVVILSTEISVPHKSADIPPTNICIKEMERKVDSSKTCFYKMWLLRNKNQQMH